jgi:hypothetical protein
LRGERRTGFQLRRDLIVTGELRFVVRLRRAGDDGERQTLVGRRMSHGEDKKNRGRNGQTAHGHEGFTRFDLDAPAGTDDTPGQL